MQLQDKLSKLLNLSTESLDIINAAANAAIEFYGDYCTHLHENISENVHGETQKRLDLQADNIFTKHFLQTDCVGLICSEEQELPIKSKGTYSVCFDPLDGSSVIESNFATGSVFGVYPTTELLGKSPRLQTCSFYFVYGPNLVLNITDGSTAFTGKFNGFSFEFRKLDNLTKNVVLAPGNFKLIADSDFVDKLQAVSNTGLALRYSGALVSDIHMLFIRGGGLFVRPALNNQKPKLRLLYECGPLAFFANALKGKAVCLESDLLDIEIIDFHQTTDIFLGNTNLVDLWLDT